MCSSWANQSNGLKIESSIHSQITALSATGVVHGSRTRNRTNHRPRKLAVRTKPRTVERITTSACEMAVKTNVLRSVVRKTGSLTAAMKVWRPAKCRLWLPVVASLNAYTNASTRG